MKNNCLSKNSKSKYNNVTEYYKQNLNYFYKNIMNDTYQKYTVDNNTINKIEYIVPFETSNFFMKHVCDMRIISEEKEKEKKYIVSKNNISLSDEQRKIIELIDFNKVNIQKSKKSENSYKLEELKGFCKQLSIKCKTQDKKCHVNELIKFRSAMYGSTTSSSS
jgi:hypothetical protein